MDNNKSSILFWPCQLQIGVTLSKKILWKNNNWYSLTSPYGHLSITDSSFGPRNAKNHTFPASIIRTLASVTLVSY